MDRECPGQEKSTFDKVEDDHYYLELVTKGISIDLLAHPLLVKGAHLERWGCFTITLRGIVQQ